jgi:hypothetical protein
METNEAKILALIALGAMTVDSYGQIWRHREITRGSAIGGREVACKPRRADTGRSSTDGYLRVQATIGPDRVIAPAHRIVWMVANQRMIPSGFEINHKNGTKSDNRPDNLELVSRAGNAIHALHSLGQYRTSRNGKLTPEMVVQIRYLRDQKIASRVLVAEQFAVSTVMVKKIERRESWAWVPEK